MGDDALSQEANNLMATLVAAGQRGKEVSKQRFPSTDGVGLPFIHENEVGGVENVRQALDNLKEAGYPISVSKGDRDRYIQVEGRI